MLQSLNLEHLLLLDIETVPQYINYEAMPENWQKLWNKKALTLRKDQETPEELYQRAGIYAEFGKIICISCGFFKLTKNQYQLYIKSYFHNDEVQLLKEFSEMLKNDFVKAFCAHNGKEFDFPYISRRLMINGLSLPNLLNNAGKKPWEIAHLDTMELWKFGDYKNYTSLELLAALFGIPTPKDDIDGSMVYHTYYQEPEGLNRIATYCQKDVVTLANILLKWKGQNLLTPEMITYK